MTQSKYSYLKKSMTIGYGLIVNDNINWPSSFTVDMKVTLVKGWLEYWSDIEDYEKCAVLKKIIDNLEKKSRGKKKN